MKKIAFWLLPGLLILGTGCIALQTPADLDYRDQQAASMSADIQTLKEERQRLVHVLEAMREENAEQAYKIQDLAKRLDLVEQQYATTNAAYKQKLQEVQGIIASESQARVTAINDMKTAVSAELSQTASKIQEQVKAAQKAYESAPQGEYTVQKGDNLMIIAKACGVTMDSIRKANKLKADTLHAGQKLVIPKK